VVEEYLRTCLEQGINEVRMIHGKGKGVPRRTVHAILDRDPQVLRYGLDSGASGWGVTPSRNLRSLRRERRESGRTEPVSSARTGIMTSHG
jgi:hypothetical protein